MLFQNAIEKDCKVWINMLLFKIMLLLLHPTGDTMLQDSFAIYSSGKCELDVHINIWTDLCCCNYIDFGVRIKRVESFEGISLFIPYAVKERDFSDLIETIKTEELIRGIFNQTCELHIKSTETSYDVELNNVDMKMVPLNALKLSLDSTGGGTVASFSIKSWSKDNIAYIRFRLPYVSLSEYLSQRGHVYLGALESPIINDSYPYNLKINEKRSLPGEILIKLDGSASINSIKIFICLPEKCSIQIDNNIYKVRMIERTVFKKYIPESLIKTNSVSYQWNYPAMDYYTFSTFFERKYINWLSVSVYSVIIIALNLLSNVIYNMIT